MRPMVFVVAIVGLIVMLWNFNQERTHTLLVDLPMMTQVPPDAIAPDYITIEVTSAGEILADGELVSLKKLGPAIQSSSQDYEYVLFRPHGLAPYGISAMTLDAIVDAGIAQNKICFDQLDYHRRFEAGSFKPASMIIEDDSQSAFIAPPDDGCALILAPGPIY